MPCYACGGQTTDNMWKISSLSSMWGPRDPAHVPRLSSKWLHPLSIPLAQAWGFNVASGLVL